MCRPEQKHKHCVSLAGLKKSRSSITYFQLGFIDIEMLVFTGSIHYHVSNSSSFRLPNPHTLHGINEWHVLNILSFISIFPKWAVFGIQWMFYPTVVATDRIIMANFAISKAHTISIAGPLVMAKLSATKVTKIIWKYASALTLRTCAYRMWGCRDL